MEQNPSCEPDSCSASQETHLLLWNPKFIYRETATGPYPEPISIKSITKYFWVMKWRMMRRAWHVARMADGRNGYMVLVGWHEGKRPLGRARYRWEDNIKMYLREYESMGRTGFECLGVGSAGGLLWTRWWTFECHKESGLFFDRL